MPMSSLGVVVQMAPLVLAGCAVYCHRLLLSDLAQLYHVHRRIQVLMEPTHEENQADLGPGNGPGSMHACPRGSGRVQM